MDTDNMIKRILVTGADGQLGTCFQALSPGYAQLQFIFKTTEELNITDFQAVSRIFQEERLDYFLNCAAYTAVDKAEEEQSLAYLVNTEAVTHLAKCCKEHEVILIHFSTDFVFDGNSKVPYSEDDLPNPISVYGASKFDGERGIRETLKAHFIIRTSWLYSEYGNNFVKTMRKLGKCRRTIDVVDDQRGNPTYAMDLAEFTIFLMNNGKAAFGTYHYSNLGTISWFEFAKEIFEISQLKVEVEPISSEEFRQSAERPVFSALDTQKVKELDPTLLRYWKSSLARAISRM